MGCQRLNSAIAEARYDTRIGIREPQDSEVV